MIGGAYAERDKPYSIHRPTKKSVPPTDTPLVLISVGLCMEWGKEKIWQKLMRS